MKNQVLSLDQCKELLELGIDMSDAGFVWSSINDKDYNPVSWIVIHRDMGTTIETMRKEFPLTYKEGNLYYAYSLTDILSKFKKYELNKVEDNNVMLKVSFNDFEYAVFGEDELDMAFKVLKLFPDAFK